MTRFKWFIFASAALSTIAAGLLLAGSGRLSVWAGFAALAAAVCSVVGSVGGARHYSPISSQSDAGIAHAWSDAAIMISFAKAILAAVPPKTESATMVLIEQCMIIKHKTARETELSTAALHSFHDEFAAATTTTESLATAHARIEEYLTSMACRSVEIDADMQRLLESLQFQDITRQMIEGAIAILEDLMVSLETIKPVGEGPNGFRQGDYYGRLEKVRELLISRSKTEDEKIAITGVKR